MPLDLKKDLSKGQTVVLIIPNDKYMARISEVAKYMGGAYSKTCYVSLNKIVVALSRSLDSSGADSKKFFFIDGVTKSANPDAPECPNCVFVSSASALTDLSIAIDDVIKKENADALLFDSLSTLLIYNKDEVVTKFIHNLTNKLQTNGITTIFAALEGDMGSELIKEIGMFVDGIVKID